ncbi:ATP-binding cassette domain-containing protein [bacterium]|nr:ATP-binding cassette domain-containing protein [bacterium]
MKMNNDILLECQQVGKTYHTGEEELQVLEALNFTLHPHEFVAITGESGCGKSTLLHLLGALDTPSAGDILYQGKSLAAMSDSKKNRVRNREFGFVFQFHYLLPEFSALENVMLPGFIAGTAERELKDRANHLLDELRLQGRKEFKPYKLSGGEQQRVAVARAMINRPTIVFMDEPTGNLDPAHSEEMVNLIAEQQKKKELAIIMVTHDRDIAKLAGRQFDLAAGCLRGVDG